MKPSGENSRFGLRLALVAALVMVTVVAVGLHRIVPPAGERQEAQDSPATTPKPAASNAPRTPLIAAIAGGDFSVIKRPFAVARQTATCQWTDEDGRDTNVIRQLAHNELEYERMVDENSRIFRRQLVYLKDTAVAVFERAKLTGEPVRLLALPGVDGQELQFEIVKSDSKSSSRQGMFSGHLAGNLDSMVTLAYIDGREAFTILSPKENIFLVGEPREDGQVIVKAIDPNTYGIGPQETGDGSIKTQPTK